MKINIFSLIIFVAISKFSIAQYIPDKKENFNFFYRDELHNDLPTININPERLDHNSKLESEATMNLRAQQKTASIEITTTNNKGKLTFNSLTRYNEKGRLIEFKKNQQNYLSCLYLTDTLIQKYTYGIGKKQSDATFLYKQDTFLFQKRNYKNELINENRIITNSEGKQISNLQRHGKDLSYSSEYKSFYSADGKLEKSQTFSNSLLVKEWIYSCDEKGKEVTKDPIEKSNTCKWEQSNDDGSYIHFARTLKNDKVILTRSCYNADSILILYQLFHNDSILNTEMLRTGNCEIVKEYDEKGKLKSITTVIKNDQGKITEYERVFWHRKTFCSHISFIYDNQGLLQKRAAKYGKTQLYTTTYTYNSKGQIDSIRRLKNDKLQSISKLTYTYFN